MTRPNIFLSLTSDTVIYERWTFIVTHEYFVVSSVILAHSIVASVSRHDRRASVCVRLTSKASVFRYTLNEDTTELTAFVRPPGGVINFATPFFLSSLIGGHRMDLFSNNSWPAYLGRATSRPGTQGGYTSVAAQRRRRKNYPSFSTRSSTAHLQLRSRVAPLLRCTFPRTRCDDLVSLKLRIYTNIRAPLAHMSCRMNRR